MIVWKSPTPLLEEHSPMMRSVAILVHMERITHRDPIATRYSKSKTKSQILVQIRVSKLTSLAKEADIAKETKLEV